MGKNNLLPKFKGNNLVYYFLYKVFLFPTLYRADELLLKLFKNNAQFNLPMLGNENDIRWEAAQVSDYDVIEAVRKIQRHYLSHEFFWKSVSRSVHALFNQNILIENMLEHALTCEKCREALRQLTARWALERLNESQRIQKFNKEREAERNAEGT